jgi:hypothetical protein
MIHRNVWNAAAIAVAVASSPALAGTPSAPSAFALPVETVLASSEGANGFAQAPPTLESIRYRPRHRWREPDDSGRGYGSRSTAFYQVHGGFLDPDGAQSSNALFGFRAGANMDQVQLGLGADWSHRSDEVSEVVQQVGLPSGNTGERRRKLASSSSNLFPSMAFLQLSPGAGMGVRPYVGVGGGYEVLFLSAEDFTTGDSFDATYGGWGWQAWGGLAIPLGGTTHLNAEVFRNSGEVGRDVDDAGGRYREVVNVDGTGARFGFSWGF